jgi:hypothetical protein
VRPFCKWAFEIAYHVDADDLDLNQFSDLMAKRKVLLFDEAGETVSCMKGGRTQQTVAFLQKNLVAHAKSAQARVRRPQSAAVAELPPEPKDTGESWPPQRPAKQLFEEAQKNASVKD